MRLPFTGIDQVAFPNAMVDRITPATGDRERQLRVHDFGIEDGWPVFCEDFTQWVLEDHFTAGRPMPEEVGVQFVVEGTLLLSGQVHLKDFIIELKKVTAVIFVRR